MNTTRPAAGSLLPFQQLVTGSADTPFSGCGLFGVIDPADKLVSAERRQAFPKREHVRIGSHCDLKVFLRFVHNAMKKSVRHETPAHSPETTTNVATYGSQYDG